MNPFPEIPCRKSRLKNAMSTYLIAKNKNPTILNMIGFRFIFDARLLILRGINNESYVISTIDIRFKIKSPCCLIIITTLDLK